MTWHMSANAQARRLRWAARRLELRAFGLSPEQFNAEEGFRAALAVGPLLALAVVTGHAWLGWAVFAAFWTCLCDAPGPDHRRRRLLAAFVLGGTVIAFIGSWTASYSATAALMIGSALVFIALMGAAILPASGLLGTLLAVVAVVAVGFPHPPQMAAVQALAFLAGGGWAFLLISFFWRIDPVMPLRRNATIVIARLADMVGDLIAIGDGPHRDVEWHSEHGEHRRAVRLAIEGLASSLERYPAADDDMQTWRRLLDVFEIAFSAAIALDHAHIHRLGPATERLAAAPAFRIVLAACRLTLNRQDNIETVIRRGIHRLERLRRSLSDDLMIGCIVALEDALGALTGPSETCTPLVPVQDGILSRWRERLGRALRPALMQFAGVVGVYCFAFVFHLGYPYWATMAVIVVLQGGARVTWTRCLERILGSLLGGLFAMALLCLVGGAFVLSALAIVLVAASIALRSVNYTLFVVFLTMLFITVTEMLMPGAGIASARMLDNVLGSLAALVAVLALWPDLGPPLSERLAKGYEANRAYLDAVVTGKPRTGIRAARRAAGLASVDVEIALHDLGGLLRRWHRMSAADVSALRDLRELAGEAACAWHKRLVCHPKAGL